MRFSMTPRPVCRSLEPRVRAPVMFSSARGRDDRARRRPADQVEMIAETPRAAILLFERALDLCEERQGDDAAHAAAVDRENPLRPRRKQMAVTRDEVRRFGRLFAHLRPPEIRPLPP